MRFRHGFSSVLALLGLVATSTPAGAFCRTTTQPIPADYNPQSGCYTQGKLLYWANACVGYSLQRDASKQVTLAQATDGMARAFGRWQAAACEGGGAPSIAAKDLGPVACSDVRYNQYSPNAHVIVFRDDGWPHNDSNNTLALTTVTFNVDNGEIYDADMEINSTVAITTSPVPVAGSYDFASIVTHEAGHFLGLAHSVDESAIMFAHYKPGGAVTPTADDVAGICAIYAPGGNRATTLGVVPETPCDPTPRHGFTTCVLADGGVGEPADTPPSGTSGGCSASPRDGGRASGGAAALLLAGLVGTAIVSARARRRAGGGR